MLNILGKSNEEFYVLWFFNWNSTQDSMNTEGHFTHILQAEHPSTSWPVLPSVCRPHELYKLMWAYTNEIWFVHFFQELDYVKCKLSTLLH